MEVLRPARMPALHKFGKKGFGLTNKGEFVFFTKPVV